MAFQRRLLKKNELQRAETLKKEKYRGSRLSIVIFFFGTILISSLIWLKDNFKEWWQKINHPVVYKINKVAAKNLIKVIGMEPDFSNLDGLRNTINHLLKDTNGEYGYYYYDLTTRKSFGAKEDQVFIAASVNKVPIMVGFFTAVEKGRISEKNTYVLQEEDIQDYGSGVIRYQSPGTSYNLESLLKLMGKSSDNTAAYVLENMVGMNTIQKNLDKLGMKNTNIANNTTTPREMGDYLVKLYQDELVSEESKNKILEALTDTDFEDRITLGVPEYIKVAHKIGNEVQVYNDCGIILGSKPYVLCILTKEVLEDEALDIIPKISRLIWEFANKD